MKPSRLSRFSASPLAALGLVVSVSLMPQAQAATDTSLTNQTISTVIDDVGGPNTVSRTTTATATLSGNNTFSGGLFIKAGTVKGNTNNSTVFGADIIHLGDTTGSSNTTLQTNPPKKAMRII
jgi:autotransporter-associated beta strand protein